MTNDQQLIDETAAAIAEDLFTDGSGRVADRIVMEFGKMIPGHGWSRGPVKDVIAKHLAAMLAKKQEAELASIERLLFDEPEQPQPQ